MCNYRGWYAGRIWRIDGEGNLHSTGHAYGFGTSLATGEELADVACIIIPSRDCVVSAASTAQATINGSRDSCLAQAWDVSIKGILALPVKVDDSLTFVLEFFSESAINLEQHTRVVAGHVATQLSHVEARELARQKVEELAFTDLITRLPNRTGFEHLFRQKLKDAKISGTCLALMFIDLDGFKRVNDSLGHQVGDNLLRTVANRLDENLRSSDIAGRIEESNKGIAVRLGGDEFTLVLSDIENSGDAAIVAQRFLDLLSEPIDVGSQDV